MFRNTEVDVSSAVYMAQASDAMDYLKVLKQNELEIAFKINLLFFDEIILNAASLLGNKMLLEMMTCERQTFSKMYQDGFIRPLLREDPEKGYPLDLVGIAEGMIASGTLTGNPPADLKRHAKIIAAAHPNFVTIDNRMFRDCYDIGLKQILRNARSYHTPHDDQAFDRVVDAAMVKGAFESVSALIKYCEGELGAADTPFFHMATEYSGQSVNSILGGGRLSIPEEFLKFGLMQGTTAQSTGDHSDASEFHDEVFDFPLALDKLTQLPLSMIVTLRDIEEFVDVRHMLSIVRSTGQLNINELVVRLTECFQFIQSLARQSSSEMRVRIEQVLEHSRARRNKVRVKWMDTSILSVGFLVAVDQLVIDFIEVTETMSTVASVSGIGTGLLGRLLDLSSPSDTGSRLQTVSNFETNFRPDVIYNPKEALLRYEDV